jgi:hypothetical protein
MLRVVFQSKSWEATGGNRKLPNAEHRAILYIGLLKQQCYNNQRKERFTKFEVPTAVLLKMHIV